MAKRGQSPSISWTVSIVSHGHEGSVWRALSSIHAQMKGRPHEFILTVNDGANLSLSDALPQSMEGLVRIIVNKHPKGFGENHNQALRDARGAHILIADPDLSVEDDIFDDVEDALSQQGVGVVAPLAVDENGMPEDNGRQVLTPRRLLRRYSQGRRLQESCALAAGVRRVDWVAGLFMAMRSETFHGLNGFDERYYMYCEDMDLCTRARFAGMDIVQIAGRSVMHPARRKSSRNIRHLYWHLHSLMLFWRSPAFRHFHQSP